MKKTEKKPISPIIKDYNYNSVKSVEPKDAQVNTEKMELLTSLVKDLRMQCKIFQQTLADQGQDPDKTLRDGGYTGVINNTTVRNKKKEDEQNNEGLEGRNSQQIGSMSKSYSKDNRDNQYEPKNNNPYATNHIKQPQENNVHSNSNLQQSEDDYNISDDDFDVFIYILLRNLESNKADKNNLVEEINNIFTRFSNENQALSRNAFAYPFANLFYQETGSQFDSDKDIIMTNFLWLISSINDDTEKFRNFLLRITDAMIDYKDTETEKQKDLKYKLGQ
ncbi:MAG: hypothetical protein MJY42_00210 [Bacteroidales bacterium]|nr:hypothetical protein [Bacteroidales bacterium]